MLVGIELVPLDLESDALPLHYSAPSCKRVDPDQTPRSVASDLGLQFAHAYLSQYLASLRYVLKWPRQKPGNKLKCEVSPALLTHHLQNTWCCPL